MAHAHRGLARACPSASSTARRAAGRTIYRDGIAALGADFCDVDGDEQDRRLDAQRRASRRCSTRTRARARTARPSTAATATSRAGASIEFAGRRAAPRLHRRRGDAAVPEPHATATRSSSAPARPARPRPTCSPSAGWSVIMLEKGRNHLLALDAPFGPLGHVSNDEIKFIRRHFLGPDPFLEPRTLPPRRRRRRPPLRGRGQQPAVDRRRRRLPRRRQAPALPRGRLQGALRARSDRRRRHRRLARRLRRDGAVLRRGRAARSASPGDAGANPFAEWRSGPYPMPPGADMFGAVLTTEAATRLGYHPYRAPTGVNSVPVRRPARVQQLRLLRRSSAARSTRRAIRSRRCATRCAPGAARSAPSRYVERVLLDAAGQHGARRALPRRRRQRARGERARRRGRGRRVGDARGCCCAPRSRTRPVSSAGTSCTTSRRS